jgi:hypothetical protein
MVDHRHMGQITHRGPSAAAMVALGCVASTVLVGCGGSVAGAPTTLLGVVEAQVVHANGSVVTGVNSLQLHRGDLVRTGPAGRAELHTRSRTVYIGSDSAVQVLDGARQNLRHGALVVDAKSGPGLALDVGDLAVQAPHGSAVRTERGVTTRVGTLIGRTDLTTDTGRSMQVPALSQVVVAGTALPDDASPLRLTDDDGEAHAAPSLVRDDLALNSLATGIDTTGRETIESVAAAWHGSLVATPVGVAHSEQVLPIVIAAAGQPKHPQDRYREAVALRTDGGSWGVIAHRLDTDSGQVLAALGLFERGASTGHVGSVPPSLRLFTSVLDNASSNAVSTTPSSRPSSGGHTSSPHPSPSPSATESGLVGTVTDTINKVLKVLPTPTALPILPNLKVPGSSSGHGRPQPTVSSSPLLPTPALRH